MDRRHPFNAGQPWREAGGLREWLPMQVRQQGRLLNRIGSCLRGASTSGSPIDLSWMTTEQLVERASAPTTRSAYQVGV
jgi:hypothetical protein